MTTQRGTVFIRQLDLSSRYTIRHLEGLSDADLLLQPESRGNCANWVLGHIVATRETMLKALDHDFIWDEETIKLYNRKSAAITGADSPHLKRDELFAAHEATTNMLKDCFEKVSDEKLDTVINENGGTVSQRLDFLLWHESYHVGQFEYLRQLTGVNDTVIP